MRAFPSVDASIKKVKEQEAERRKNEKFVADGKKPKDVNSLPAISASQV